MQEWNPKMNLLQNTFTQLQKVGGSLMLPIAVLPVAALLLRFGSGDLLDIPFIKQSGGEIFANLPFIFAIGLAKNNNGTAGLAAATSQLILVKGATTIDSTIIMGVLSGVIAGLLGSWLYNKYHAIKHPDWLGFFDGKRFVPISTALITILLAFVPGHLFPYIGSIINSAGEFMVSSQGIGKFDYGFSQRMLIPFGLHHTLNSISLFMFGTFTDPSGVQILGDQLRFFAGDPTAGDFMTGGFPIMMFGLPAVCLTFYVTAKAENKKAFAGILFSVAITSFLIGITTSIVFLIMFNAPLLYLIHAILTGISYMVALMLDIKHGFGFSAGAIDYVLNWGLATKPLLLTPIDLIVGTIYFLIFTSLIKLIDLKTVGREDVKTSDRDYINTADASIENLARKYYLAVGGKDNIVSINCCMPRLRLTLKKNAMVDNDQYKKPGAAGIIKPTDTTIQIIVGTTAELIASTMQDIHNKEVY